MEITVCVFGDGMCADGEVKDSFSEASWAAHWTFAKWASGERVFSAEGTFCYKGMLSRLILLVSGCETLIHPPFRQHSSLSRRGNLGWSSLFPSLHRWETWALMYCAMAQALTHGQHPTKRIHAFTILSTNQGKGTMKDVQVNGTCIFFPCRNLYIYGYSQRLRAVPCQRIQEESLA